MCGVIWNVLFAFSVVSWLIVSSSFAQDGETQAQARTREYPPLREDVERRQVVIWSDGTRMTGDLYLPKNRKPADKLPAIVFANGTGGSKRKQRGGGQAKRLAKADGCWESGCDETHPASIPGQRRRENPERPRCWFACPAGFLYFGAACARLCDCLRW